MKELRYQNVSVFKVIPTALKRMTTLNQLRIVLLSMKYLQAIHVNNIILILIMTLRNQLKHSQSQILRRKGTPRGRESNNRSMLLQTLRMR
jgi:hypothetical protein